jgi:phosphoserine phosphatase
MAALWTDLTTPDIAIDACCLYHSSTPGLQFFREICSMTKILLIRHGNVEGIKPQRFRGRTDLELTPLGISQAAATAQRIVESWQPCAVFTSPLRRCVSTGKPIADVCGVRSETIDGLVDLDYGTWQWKTNDEVRSESPQLFDAWHTSPHLVRFPKGESLQDLVARTSDALRFVLDEYAGKTVVLVGHDSVNRALLLQLIDQPLSAYWRLAQDPCAINEIDVEEFTIRVSRVNETHHLAHLSR